ncbi:uncharacterized protein M6B38_331085 [Iris pallida]|uniref:BPL/LPL catalytic domain-containing protein n=1 Tax=Iris pallida TaxID=29817 RepID=A0AAX6H2Y1_IRIPA|nr:Uncharacterized protein M6B38_226635 [Iris pallida]KAJ6835369.1 uncharacterized protein M6B38_331085 [Iris pallida]
MLIPQSKQISLPLINLIRLNSFPILNQLHLEEKLLRTTSGNWCIVNDGAIPPTIVMGVSGKLPELVNLDLALRDNIPVVRRFSGGGTVIVDDGTIFVTLICNKNAVPGLQPYPQPIMSWTGQMYGDVFHGSGDFRLRENDYAFGARKFGGNAQSITKNRWVHHTSFLWDYDAKNMEYLKLPAKAPEYRSSRGHMEFLCRMKEYVLSRSIFMERLMSSLGSHFSVEFVEEETVAGRSDTPYHCSSKLLTRQELEEACLSQHENLG